MRRVGHWGRGIRGSTGSVRRPWHSCRSHFAPHAHPALPSLPLRPAATTHSRRMRSRGTWWSWMGAWCRWRWSQRQAPTSSRESWTQASAPLLHSSKAQQGDGQGGRPAMRQPLHALRPGSWEPALLPVHAARRLGTPQLPPCLLHRPHPEPRQPGAAAGRQERALQEQRAPRHQRQGAGCRCPLLPLFSSRGLPQPAPHGADLTAACAKTWPSACPLSPLFGAHAGLAGHRHGGGAWRGLHLSVVCQVGGRREEPAEVRAGVPGSALPRSGNGDARQCRGCLACPFSVPSASLLPLLGLQLRGEPGIAAHRNHLQGRWAARLGQGASQGSICALRGQLCVHS